MNNKEYIEYINDNDKILLNYYIQCNIIKETINKYNIDDNLKIKINRLLDEELRIKYNDIEIDNLKYKIDYIINNNN